MPDNPPIPPDRCGHCGGDGCYICDPDNYCSNCEQLYDSCTYCSDCDSHECQYCSECRSHGCVCDEDDEDDEDDDRIILCSICFAEHLEREACPL